MSDVAASLTRISDVLITLLRWDVGHVTMIAGGLVAAFCWFSGNFQGLMSGEPYEIVEHTADWSLRVRGADLGELFANAAKGMAMLMVEEPEALGYGVQRTLEMEAYDAESLLVDWLNELAYWAEREGLVFSNIDINEIGEGRLAATVRGGEAPVLDKHIKAVTFHNLVIVETASGLEVTIVFDV